MNNGGENRRNHIAFWIFGLSNNYAYVIMLSAAFDILNKFKKSDLILNNTESEECHCNDTSTGAVLIADILPCLLIKVIAPFAFHNINFRICIVVILSALSFIITGFSTHIWMSYLGIICASLSSGLGETTFLAYATHFDSGVITWWSAGTGAAGILGSFSYALLISVGMSPRDTLLVMTIVPILMGITYRYIVISPHIYQLTYNSPLLINEDDDENDLNQNNDETIHRISFLERLNQIRPTLKYMIPLMLVYYFEYFINQGLFELVCFSHIWLSHSEQYRWYQVDYQIGVLISRSSISFVKIKRTNVLALLQFVNVVIILIQIFHPFMPNIWFMLVIVFFEGLLGGAAYVNTFYKIFKDVDPKWKEFSMSITTLSDSIGITVAGFTAIPIHDKICKILYQNF